MKMGELTNWMSNGPDFFTARLSLWKDVAMVVGVKLHVGGAWGGMAGSVATTFNYIVERKKGNGRFHKPGELWT